VGITKEVIYLTKTSANVFESSKKDTEDKGTEGMYEEDIIGMENTVEYMAHKISNQAQKVPKRKIVDKGKELVIKSFHTNGRLGNILSWSDQHIPNPVEYIVGLEFIAYNQRRHAIVKRM
jgi:hypothetical protein